MGAGPEGHVRARGLAGIAGDDVDRAGHRVGAPGRRRGTADDLDLADVGLIEAERVPQDCTEEVEVDAATVDEDELGVGGRRRGAAVRERDVTRGEADDVDARQRTQHVGDIGSGSRRDAVRAQRRRRHRSVDEADGIARGRDHEGLAEAGQDQRDLDDRGRGIGDLGIDRRTLETGKRRRDTPGARAQVVEEGDAGRIGDGLDGRGAGGAHRDAGAGQRQALRIDRTDDQTRREVADNTEVDLHRLRRQDEHVAEHAAEGRNRVE